jgi:DNA-binding transcriptional MocR family regulator
MSTSPPPRWSRASQALRSSAVRDLLHDAHLPDMISLAGGLPAPELFDVVGIDLAWQSLRDEGLLAGALQYGRTEGQPSLRAALARWTSEQGCPTQPDQVLVTSGSQQGLDLVTRALVDPGDTVVTESPTYLAALQVFDLAGARIASVPNDAQGACIDALEAMPRDHRPKLVYLVTNFANPSGACLSLERRLQLLRWAAKQQVFVLEDDPYGLLRLEGMALPSLRELTREVPEAAPWVGYASSLSKVLAPGMRLGWLVLPPTLQAVCARIKQALDLHTASLTQELAARYLDSGRLQLQLPTTRAAYRERRDALCNALTSQLSNALSFERPEGGMFVWARWRDGLDSQTLLPAARDAGVLFVPGSAFHPDGTGRSYVRLSFVTAPPERINLGVERLAKALSSE